MNHLILLLLLFISQLAALGQTTLRGRLLTPKGKPVPGASLAIKDSYDGATSDSTGRFQFETTEKGRQLLQVTAIGYKPVEEWLELNGSPVDLQLILKEAIDELKAVVVTAGSFEASDTKRTTVLSSIDVVTTASANADVTAALRTLPGTQQIGEREGLFVRGGSGEEARVFIDGTLVNNFFYSALPDLATRGRFYKKFFKVNVFN